jgi:hypothetical protein
LTHVPYPERRPGNASLTMSLVIFL